ncbi:hypothetical protein [Aquimarina rhabdastrellae]
MKKKNKITLITGLMLGLASIGLQAQGGGVGTTSSSRDRAPGFDLVNSRESGIYFRADSDNDRNRESFRFVIGGGNESNFNAEINRKGFLLRGLSGSDYAEFESNRGLRITSNSDKNNAAEPILFRVGNNSSFNDIVRMSFNEFYVFKRAIFEGAATVTRNLIVHGQLGIGTSIPSEKIHINNGNIRVDGGQYQSHGSIILHPDVDGTGDDSIEFRNSSNEEMAKVQDGELRLHRRGTKGGLISSNAELKFQPDNDDTGDDRVLFLNQSGDVMVHIQDGVITTDQVQLNVTTFPDYVFAKDYKLMPLKEVAQYIKTNKHLPNMPTEAEVVAEGMNVGQINTVLVEKVEELTLHTINQEEKIEQLMKKIEALEAAMNK